LIGGYQSLQEAGQFYDALTDDQRRALPISREQFESLFLTLVENPAFRKLTAQQGVDVVSKIAPLIGSTWIEAANKSTGVLCLSEIADSLLMWSHYADRHRGIVIEFDADQATFNCRRGPKDEFYHLRQVVYSEARPSTLDHHDGTTVLLTKAPDWAYEREWRIFKLLKDAKHVIDKQPLVICLFDVPVECIRRVVFGARIDKAILMEEVRRVRQATNLAHIKLTQARLKLGSFALDLDNEL
jgi:hypothetical protein